MNRLAALLALACLLLRATGASEAPGGAPAGESIREGHWRADHHMHLASADICARIGDCLPDNDPPSVLAVDAVAALDAAGVSRGVVFSSGYLYGLEGLDLDPEAITRYVRRENEFTAVEVSNYPARLVGFLSVDPLQPSALEEIRHWHGRPEFVGVKLHFAASGVDVHNDAHRDAVASVFRKAAAENLSLTVHVGGGRFDAAEAEAFIQSLLPAARESWVQIAHAGGGHPFVDGRHVRILEVFADYFAKDDRRMRRVLFDISYVPAPEEDGATTGSLIRTMRRIGLKRFLFGSDFNVLTPSQAIGLIDRLQLTREEETALRQNCAPWVCAMDEISQ